MKAIARVMICTLVASVYWVTSLYWLASPLTAQADTMITLQDDQHGEVFLNDALEFYNPGLQEPDIDAIRQLDNAAWHNVSDLSHKQTLSSRHTLWFRFNIYNQSDLAQALVLKTVNPMVDNFESYSVIHNTNNGDDNNSATLNQLVPQNTGGTNNFIIKLPEQSHTTIYAKSTGFNSAYAPLKLYSQHEFNKEQYTLQLFHNIIAGSILGLSMYILLLGIKTRQAIYFAYSTLGLCNLIGMITYQNTFTPLNNLLSDQWRSSVLMLMPLLITCSVIYFCQLFLNTIKTNKKFNDALNVHISIILLAFMAYLLGAPIKIIVPIYTVITLSSVSIIIYLCIIDKNNKKGSIAMILTGIILPLLSGIFILLIALGTITPSSMHSEVTQASTALQMMAFAIAITIQIQELHIKNYQQKKSAKEARIISDSHDRLLAHLNHELRTPLNGIIGAAEILMHKSNLQERNIFSMIYQTALPLKHMVDDMVNINSITGNNKENEITRFDLQNLLQECMDIFLPTSHSKSNRLFFRIDQDIATDVTGNPNQLRQILLNLIGNACKFTINGEIGVNVSHKKSPDNNKILYYFEVIDSGAGITQSDEQRLFEAFETNKGQENPQGTGIGLTIARQLSQKMGGDCGYHKNDGQGSTFWFSAALIPHQTISRKTHQAFENQHILIADKSIIISEQIKAQIYDAAARVSTAHSTDATITAIRSGDYNLAIIHQSINNEKIQKSLADSSCNAIFYIDQSEAIGISFNEKKYSEKSIIRKISTERFSLQIAELIIRNNNLAPIIEPSNKKLNNMKILVAEDIPTNQQIILALLESIGITPVICNNGMKAFQLYVENLLDNNGFDAIIMDCEMPIQDGFETARQIRNYENEFSLAPINIIALTAHTELSYRQRSMDAGMNIYLTKPVSLDEMRQCLSNLDAGKS